MENITEITALVTGMMGLLLIAATVLAFSKRMRIPFTVALVVVGVIFAHLLDMLPGQLKQVLHYEISPDFVFFVCLPTLIFESAFNLDARKLRANLLPVLTLAIPGLLLSTGIIGAIVYFLSPLSLQISLLLGAILSATDPVAVISLFKQLGAPKRLSILVEGESLFNDATAIVTAKLIFAVIIAGVFTTSQITHGISDFAIEFVGGIIVGAALAFLIGFILGFINSDPYIEISLITVLAYTSFLIASELLHVSGVMSTLASALVMASWGKTKISPSIREYLEHYWDYLSFIANALIFFLVGISVNLGALIGNWYLLLVTIIAMLVSRAVVIYGLLPVVSKLPGFNPVSNGYRAIMYWGGLRGAIALAIVLSLGQFEQSDTLVILVTGAVLFTLIVQGLTMPKLMHWFKLDEPSIADQLIRSEAELTIKRRIAASIPDLQLGGFFSARIAHKLQSETETEIKSIQNKITHLREHKLTPENEKRLVFLQTFAQQKNLIFILYSSGNISDHVYHFFSSAIETQMDHIRSEHELEDFESFRKQGKLALTINKFGKSIPLVKHYFTYMQAKRTLSNYEEFWCLHQLTLRVLAFLEQLRKDASVSETVLNNIEQYYQSLLTHSQSQLLSITEQFPEFVSAMQERYAERLLLHTELAAIHEQQHAGVVPEGIAENIENELSTRLLHLRERLGEKIELDPLELLNKVPFFKDLSDEDFDKVQARLQKQLVPAGDDIIKQGEHGTSLYLIMRGVINVYRQTGDKEERLACLMAGDFFGEMALLEDKPRNATCRAATPCALYVLTRKDFDEVRQLCPALQRKVKELAKERR